MQIMTYAVMVNILLIKKYLLLINWFIKTMIMLWWKSLNGDYNNDIRLGWKITPLLYLIIGGFWFNYIQLIIYQRTEELWGLFCEKLVLKSIELLIGFPRDFGRQLLEKSKVFARLILRAKKPYGSAGPIIGSQ